MIQVTINRTESGKIHSFVLSGHAFFADRGKDIVCAGVSAVSFGAINSVIGLTGVQPVIKKDKSAFLHCEIPEQTDVETEEKVQLLLEGMVVSLQTIERDYGKHIKITFKKQGVK